MKGEVVAGENKLCIQIEIHHPILSANQKREARNLGVLEIFHQSLVGEGGEEERISGSAPGSGER